MEFIVYASTTVTVIRRLLTHFLGGCNSQLQTVKSSKLSHKSTGITRKPAAHYFTKIPPPSPRKMTENKKGVQNDVKSDPMFRCAAESIINKCTNAVRLFNIINLRQKICVSDSAGILSIDQSLYFLTLIKKARFVEGKKTNFQ